MVRYICVEWSVMDSVEGYVVKEVNRCEIIGEMIE